MAESVARGPLLRFPFLWAFLVGIVLLTLIRPCLRRVPEPPAVSGRFPDAALTDAGGSVISLTAGGGTVSIVLYVRGGCGGPCEEALARLRELVEVYQADRVDGIRAITVVAEDGTADGGTESNGTDPARRGPAPTTSERLRGMATAIGAAPPRWTFVTADAAALAALEAALMTGAPAPGPVRLAIVDTSGNLRGTYTADTDGFNEVYNRARHVRDAPGPSAAPPPG